MQDTRPPVIEVTEAPTGVYIGSEIIEGYAKLMFEDMDILPKRRAAVEAAVLEANKSAIEKSYLLSKGKEPVCKGSVATLSIRISPPKEEKPYTEATPVHYLPPAAINAIKPITRHGEKYYIIVVSVVFTARWVCLPKGSIPGLPKDTVTPSTGKTYIGNNTYDFGCPHPSEDRITEFEKIEVHVKPHPLKGFIEKYPLFDQAFEKEFETHLFNELFPAIQSLPKCPVECPETDLSVTIGYPQSLKTSGEERIDIMERQEQLIMPPVAQHRMTTVRFEQHNYVMKGKWSWSVQRTCCSDK